MRVTLADDSVLFREGLTRLLESAGLSVIGRAADAVQLMALVDAEPPDIAITDICMPPSHTTEGLDAAVKIRDKHPQTAVLLLSAHYAFWRVVLDQQFQNLRVD